MRLPTPRSVAIPSGLIAIVDLTQLPGDLIEDLAFHGALVSLQTPIGPAEVTYNRVDDTRGLILTRPLENGARSRGPLLDAHGDPITKPMLRINNPVAS